MNIFKQIKRTLEKYIPFLRRNEDSFQQKTIIDIEPELNKIIEEQNALRIETAREIEGSRILDLTPKQKNLIEKKSELINLEKDEFKLIELIEINSQIELLETNLFLQARIKFFIKSVNKLTLQTLKKELENIEKSNPSYLKLDQNRENSHQIRNDEIPNLLAKKHNILNFSLIEMHKKREEERIEQEQIEKERKLDEQYRQYVQQSIDYLQNNEFDKAIYELENALSIRPNKKNEIQVAKQKTLRIKADFEKRKERFNELFQLAENDFHNKKFSNAIGLYTSAKVQNINNYLCNTRIKDAKYQISRIEHLESERKRKEQEQKERRKKYKEDAHEIIK